MKIWEKQSKMLIFWEGVKQPKKNFGRFRTPIITFSRKSRLFKAKNRLLKTHFGSLGILTPPPLFLPYLGPIPKKTTGRPKKTHQ